MADIASLPIGLLGLSTGPASIVGPHVPIVGWKDVDTSTKGRTKSVVLWDAVASRASLVEREGERRDGDRYHHSPETAPSVTCLAERKGLRAAVVLDAGWTGLWSARRLAEEQLPVLWLGDEPRPDAWSFQGLGRDLIVPGLTLRTSPATLRLRELIATNVGPVDSIIVTHDEATPRWQLLDWAMAVVNSPVIDRETFAGEGTRYHHKTGVTTDVTRGDDVDAMVTCQRGLVHWRPTTEITWRPSAADVWQPVETHSDRDAVTVLLDLFFRRVFGGLVPVPSVDDVQQAIRWADDC